MIDSQTYKDRLLETENLTTDLEDVEADWLLQWGVAQIDLVTDGLAEEAAADEQIGVLMSFMRRASRTVARKDRRTPAELAEALNELGGIYAQLFGGCRPLSPAECEPAAIQMQQLAPLAALQFLVEWFKPL
jgi:hypothetical protein